MMIINLHVCCDWCVGTSLATPFKKIS